MSQLKKMCKDQENPKRTTRKTNPSSPSPTHILLEDLDEEEEEEEAGQSK